VNTSFPNPTPPPLPHASPAGYLPGKTGQIVVVSLVFTVLCYFVGFLDEFQSHTETSASFTFIGCEAIQANDFFLWIASSLRSWK
jgi:hypothetical protein